MKNFESTCVEKEESTRVVRGKGDFEEGLTRGGLAVGSA